MLRWFKSADSISTAAIQKLSGRLSHSRGVRFLLPSFCDCVGLPIVLLRRLASRLLRVCSRWMRLRLQFRMRRMWLVDRLRRLRTRRVRLVLLIVNSRLWIVHRWLQVLGRLRVRVIHRRSQCRLSPSLRRPWHRVPRCDRR